MGKNNKTKPIPLDILSEQLINQLKEREFAEGTIHCIEVELGHLQEVPFCVQILEKKSNKCYI